MLKKTFKDRYRCPRRNYSFHDFSCRWIDSGRLSYVQWLWIIKLFVLEVLFRKMAHHLGLSYRGVYAAITALCLAWLFMSHAEDTSSLLGGEIKLDEAYFSGRRKGKQCRSAVARVQVFDILEREGQVDIIVAPDVQASTLLKLTAKKVAEAVWFIRIGPAATAV